MLGVNGCWWCGLVVGVGGLFVMLGAFYGFGCLWFGVLFGGVGWGFVLVFILCLVCGAGFIGLCCCYGCGCTFALCGFGFVAVDGCFMFGVFGGFGAVMMVVVGFGCLFCLVVVSLVVLVGLGGFVTVVVLCVGWCFGW